MHKESLIVFMVNSSNSYKNRTQINLLFSILLFLLTKYAD